MQNNLIIGAASVNQIPLDWEGNTSRILNTINEAKQNKVDLLCLPEMAVTGYGCEDWFYADWVQKECINQVTKIANYCEAITVVFSIPFLHKKILHNVAVVIQDKNIIALVPKQILANSGVYYESRWFTAWEQGRLENTMFNSENIAIGDILFEVKGIKCGVEVCEDAWHSHRPGKRHCEKGANIIVNPSASHFAFGKSAIRRELVKKSSNDLNCIYVYANLLGNEAGRLLFDGELLIASKGNIVKSTELNSFKDFQIIYTNCQNEIAEKYTPKSKFEELQGALPLALFDYLRKSKSRGFVLSLSGGADSTLCAVMVSEMLRRGIAELGIDNFAKKLNYKGDFKNLSTELLTCAYQATVNSGEATFTSAKELATEIGATFYSWDVDNNVNHIINTTEKALNRKLTWETDDLALQNLQAHTRAPYIWMLANIKNALLITTSNRSEGAVGYATMDGDTSGSIAPIADIDKDFILEWLQWAEKALDYTSLKHVNNMSPTAELRPKEYTQTDEKDLMPYSVLAKIEEQAIKYRLSPKQVFKNLQGIEPDELLKAHIKKFFTLWARNQWKRERLAPSFHLDDFNLDPKTWCRFPILSSGFDSELRDL
jgi:NAD+ synthase (glutamine-hydrolysing)